MHIKFTIVGYLIYAAMLLWTVSFALHIARVPARRATFFAGSGLLLVAFFWRWFETGHVPLQIMFDVFLALAVVLLPLWIFCERFLGATYTACALIVGLFVLVPAGFVFPAQSGPLMPALQSWLFIPHVSAYMLSYTILMVATAMSLVQLVLAIVHGGQSPQAVQCELVASRMVKLAFPLLTLGLVLGAVWGKLCWGDYWNWDPKELWSLATWLLFLAYLHFRSLYGPRLAWFNAVLIVLGAVCIALTLVWVNLARIFPGLHMYAS